MQPSKLFLLLTICFFLVSSRENTVGKYQCLPCGHDCDKAIYDAPGKCPECQMELVESSSITFKTISPESLCAYVKSHPESLLLDVRTREEFEGKADPDFGTLKRAVNIPVDELAARLQELKKYRNKEIIVYCSHSHRSSQASYLLTQNGFKNVTNMSGGMSVFPNGECKK